MQQQPDISQFHSSVRHYQSPFPLTHRNARAFAAPSSNQGPWGSNATVDPLDTVAKTRNTSSKDFSLAHDSGSNGRVLPVTSRERLGRGEFSLVGQEAIGWALNERNLRSVTTADVSGAPSHRSVRKVYRAPVAYVLKPNVGGGSHYGKVTPVAMGLKLVDRDPTAIPAKVTQYNPRDPHGSSSQMSGGDGGVAVPLPERLPPTPLIAEVDERLRMEGYGSLIDVRFASDEAISDLLRSVGFGPTERMTILWELRRRHPL